MARPATPRPDDFQSRLEHLRQLIAACNISQEDIAKLSSFTAAAISLLLTRGKGTGDVLSAAEVAAWKLSARKMIVMLETISNSESTISGAKSAINFFAERELEEREAAHV